METKDNNYLYNYKELNADHDLKWYDYGARFYDAVIGRWVVVDPMGEKYFGWSIYNYALNNALKYLDPNGMEVEKIVPDSKASSDLYRKVYNNASDADRKIYDRLEKSEVIYNIRMNNSSSHSGSTDYGVNQGESFEVDLNISSSGTEIAQVNALGDELEQARQFEDGEIALVKLKDGSTIGGVSYDLIDEQKSKDAGLRAAESVSDIKPDPSGNNPEKWLDAKTKGNEIQYINKLYPGISQTSRSANEDAGTINYKNVNAVAFREGSKTTHLKKN